MDSTLLQYECPCCGGRVEFNSTVQEMKCPYCDSTFNMQTIQELENVKKQDTSDMHWETGAGGEWEQGETDGMNEYTCQSCGGTIIAEETTGASKCPYCDNPIVMTGKFAGDLRPDIVIPFKLDKTAAKEALTRHLKGKVLLPKKFRDENHIDEIKGVYVPFWIFDAGADADISYHATKERTWEDNRFRYKEISHYFVRRSGNLAFERVPVDGSSKMPDDLMESVEPFDPGAAVDFQTAYLSGYLADKYDVTAEESIDRANARIRQSTEDTFRSSVQGYHSVIQESASIRLHNGRVQYALYPVWILNTTWNNEKYTFAMNGQTGKFVGNLPMDKGAFMRWFLGAFVIGSVIAYLLMMLLK